MLGRTCDPIDIAALGKDGSRNARAAHTISNPAQPPPHGRSNMAPVKPIMPCKGLRISCDNMAIRADFRSFGCGATLPRQCRKGRKGMGRQGHCLGHVHACACDRLQRQRAPRLSSRKTRRSGHKMAECLQHFAMAPLMCVGRTASPPSYVCLSKVVLRAHRGSEQIVSANRLPLACLGGFPCSQGARARHGEAHCPCGWRTGPA